VKSSVRFKSLDFFDEKINWFKSRFKSHWFKSANPAQCPVFVVYCMLLVRLNGTEGNVVSSVPVDKTVSEQLYQSWLICEYRKYFKGGWIASF